MSSLPSPSLLSGFYSSPSTRRQKTESECSETSVVSSPPPAQNGSLLPSNLATSLGRDGGERPEHYLYDVDGVFAYTYYEKKPEMYDVEGKIRYK